MTFPFPLLTSLVKISCKRTRAASGIMESLALSPSRIKSESLRPKISESQILALIS